MISRTHLVTHTSYRDGKSFEIWLVAAWPMTETKIDSKLQQQQIWTQMVASQLEKNDGYQQVLLLVN